MPRKTLEDVRQDGHWPSYGSVYAGRTALAPSRPLMSATVRCECGWKFDSGPAGFRRPDAEREHKAHLREVGGL